MASVLDTFQQRILNSFLPIFCDDPSRCWGPDGFSADWSKVSEIDAADFLRGMDGHLVEHVGRGLYRAPRSYASDQFFWSGLTEKNPRPITLWVEPIITIAVFARLHFDLGWPRPLIGGQSKNPWAFDAATHLSDDADAEHIACEVKKNTRELDELIRFMKTFGGILIW
jgi:hypothetical protein